MRNRTISTAVTVALVIVAAGCGVEETKNSAANSSHPADVTSLESDASRVGSEFDYEGNPGDILTLSNFGITENVLFYESLAQMRDFSDTVVVGRFSEYVAAVEPSDDATLSGIALLKFDVLHIIGGREAPRLSDGQLVVRLELDGERSIRAALFERLKGMEGKATYLLFLRRAAPHPKIDVPTYVINRDVGPPGVLAVWPKDGRLSPIRGFNDLAAPAIKRGEELTGVSDSNPIDIGPKFEGEAPIGDTVDELLDSFAQPVGSVSTDAPESWDLYVNLAKEAGVYE